MWKITALALFCILAILISARGALREKDNMGSYLCGLIGGACFGICLWELLFNSSIK